VALAALAGIVVLASGAILKGDPLQAGPARPTRTRAVVGDSISESAASELVELGRDAGWSVEVDATPGAITPEKQPAAERLAGGRPDAAVVHLGTNDSVCIYQNGAVPAVCRHTPYGHADMEDALETMAWTLARDGTCVVGVVPLLDAGTGEVLARLRETGTVRAVADWKAVAAGHRQEYLLDPLGHLTPEGRAAYARFVLDAVDRACPPVRSTTTPP
jgi:hypothetical protein